MAKYIVAPGFIVAGKTDGQEVKASDVDRLDVLIESGRVIVKGAESVERSGHWCDRRVGDLQHIP